MQHLVPALKERGQREVALPHQVAFASRMLEAVAPQPWTDPQAMDGVSPVLAAVRELSQGIMNARLTQLFPESQPLSLHVDKISSFSSKKEKKMQSKHLSLCSGRQGLQPAQMEFILCSVIQPIRAQDVARRVEPKNASLKQLNFMLCVHSGVWGWLRQAVSVGDFCNSCCSNELLLQWGCGWRGEGGGQGQGLSQDD